METATRPLLPGPHFLLKIRRGKLLSRLAGPLVPTRQPPAAFIQHEGASNAREGRGQDEGLALGVADHPVGGQIGCGWGIHRGGNSRASNKRLSRSPGG